MPLPKEDPPAAKLDVLKGISDQLWEEGWYAKSMRVDEAIAEIEWWRNEQSREI